MNPQPLKSAPLHQLLKVDDKDLTLKTIFDYFRNFLIAGALIAGAKFTSTNQTDWFLITFPLVRSTLAWFLLLLASALMGLNIIYGYLFLRTLGISKWLNVTITVMLALIAAVLTLVGALRAI